MDANQQKPNSPTVVVIGPPVPALPRAASDSALLMQYTTLAKHGIIVTQMVGAGGQAKVYRAFRQGNALRGKVTLPVAVKVIQKNSDKFSEQEQAKVMLHVEREIEILKVIDHDKCLKFYERIEDDENTYIITEFLHGLDLFDQAAQRVFFEDEILNIAYQLMQALSYLHERGIAHRDIKLENIVFSEKIKPTSSSLALNLRLIDFGLAYYEAFDKKEFKASDTPGTFKYKAPEVTRDGCYDPRKVDIWAVGVLMYILICGEFPFQSVEDAAVSRESYDQPAWDSISRETKKLVQALLEKNPLKRMDAARAMTRIEKVLRKENAPMSNVVCVKTGPQIMRSSIVDRQGQNNGSLVMRLQKALRM